MTDDRPNESESAEQQAEADAVPGFREAFSAAAKKSGFGQVEPGEAPTAGALLKAVGGVRGILESVLPVLGFVIIYTITKNVPWSVGVPVAVGVVFLVVRIATKTPWMSAVGGLALLAISATISLLTGQGKDNFVLGFFINGIGIVLLVISLLARRPLIGIIAAFLTGDSDGWTKDTSKFRVALVATLLWIGVFGLRLAVELPLYFADATEALGVAKLILGVPLYAAALWLTWLLMRTAYSRPKSE